MLLIILLVAAILRLVDLDNVPPGIHVDEAPNAWNAYTMLKTGKDQYGVPWPIFYTPAFGDNRTTSYIYALIPFQLVWGMNVWTTRLPAVVGGVITVLLMYVVGARLFGVAAGLVAGAMLALNPWHLQTSRWGHEASLTPLLVMMCLASLLWANMPLDDDEQRRPMPFRAIVAGILLGIAPYGYAAVRLFLPIFCLGIVLVTWRAWWTRFRTQEGALAIGAMLVSGSIIFGPLLWKHVTDPAISERAQILGRVWGHSDTIDVKIGKVASRYFDHFGLDFLFLTGDQDPALSPPPGMGLFQWYDMPLMLIGLAATIRCCKTSRAARVLLVWIALYPAGDLLYPHVSLHALRSLPGICGLVLLSALGAVKVGGWLWGSRRTNLAVWSAVAILAMVLIFNGRFLREFFGENFYRQKSSLIVFPADIIEAARWLRPRLGDVNAVFVTGQATHPDIVTLIGLGYDPQQWFRDSRELVHGPLPDGRFKFTNIYLRYGKIHFLLTESSIAEVKELSQNGRPDRVIFIVRPGELGLHEYARPVHEIRTPEGRPVLWIFALVL